MNECSTNSRRRMPNLDSELEDDILKARRAPGGCWCEETDQNGRCKACGCRVIKVSLGALGVSEMTSVGEVLRRALEPETQQRMRELAEEGLSDA